MCTAEQMLVRQQEAIAWFADRRPFLCEDAIAEDTSRFATVRADSRDFPKGAHRVRRRAR